MMRNRTIKIFSIAVIGGLSVLAACKKYVDPPAAEPDDRLTNKYCNDGKALNYNWGFPGIADNSVCIYPVDSFLGTWKFTDTLLLPNGNISSIEEKTLTFVSTEDTLRSYLAVSGWCSNSSTFHLKANKYNLAQIDTLPDGIWGQYLCGSQSDTINGTFNKKTGEANTMRINLVHTNASGTITHIGTAIKQ